MHAELLLFGNLTLSRSGIMGKCGDGKLSVGEGVLIRRESKGEPTKKILVCALAKRHKKKVPQPRTSGKGPKVFSSRQSAELGGQDPSFFLFFLLSFLSNNWSIQGWSEHPSKCN